MLDFHASYKVLSDLERKWQPRRGLEGPFFYPNGRVAYYDPKEGQYWDPKTDFYLSNQEVTDLQNLVFDKIRA